MKTRKVAWSIIVEAAGRAHAFGQGFPFHFQTVQAHVWQLIADEGVGLLGKREHVDIKRRFQP